MKNGRPESRQATFEQLGVEDNLFTALFENLKHLFAIDGYHISGGGDRMPHTIIKDRVN